MKKILTILGTVILTTTSTISLVACNPGNDENITTPDPNEEWTTIIEQNIGTLDNFFDETFKEAIIKVNTKSIIPNKEKMKMIENSLSENSVSYEFETRLEGIKIETFKFKIDFINDNDSTATDLGDISDNSTVYDMFILRNPQFSWLKENDIVILYFREGKPNDGNLKSHFDIMFHDQKNKPHYISDINYSILDPENILRVRFFGEFLADEFGKWNENGISNPIFNEKIVKAYNIAVLGLENAPQAKYVVGNYDKPTKPTGNPTYQTHVNLYLSTNNETSVYFEIKNYKE